MHQCLPSGADMDQWMPMAVAAGSVALAVLWDAVSPSRSVVDCAVLVMGCCESVCGARLLQAAYLQRWRQSGSGARAATEGAGCTFWARRLLIGCLAITGALMLVVKSRTDPVGGLKELLWGASTVAAASAALALVFELTGTSKAELADALSEKQISFSEGAAWLFFLGYLQVIFGQHGQPFSARMDDYLSQNQISEEDRKNTCTEKMFIIVPMKQKALFPDKDISACDRSVTLDSRKSLAEHANVGGRKFGETFVYKVKDGDTSYRVAFEQASPLRTAGQAADEQSCTDFDGDDFEAFAERFLRKLRLILENKPVVGCQVELVPIERVDQLGSAVARHARAVLAASLGEGGGWQPAAEGQPSDVTAARQPEESSELDSSSLR